MSVSAVALFLGVYVFKLICNLMSYSHDFLGRLMVSGIPNILILYSSVYQLYLEYYFIFRKSYNLKCSDLFTFKQKFEQLNVSETKYWSIPPEYRGWGWGQGFAHPCSEAMVLPQNV